MNLYVLPAMPNLLTPDLSDPWTLVNMIVLILAAVSVSFAVSRYAANRFGGDRRKTAVSFVGVTLCVCLLMLCFFRACRSYHPRRNPLSSPRILYVQRH